ncbi:MAG TPA: alpha/beta hydrolase [Acidimicrobiales bacterium]|nr:alpha/beta hydrolase [Acidimicrobiales bacterium]
MNSAPVPAWTPDVLGEPYEAATLALPDDGEGEVVATLVRRRAGAPTGRAVLYVHGYLDYFFQRHMADRFVARGWDFYALDLRKYGRSLRPHQTPYFTTSLDVYDDEIDQAVDIVRRHDGHESLVLAGHSTGGLVLALWAHRQRGWGLIDGLVLNSPFLEMNVRRAMRPVLAAVVGPWAKRRPLAEVRVPLNPVYGHSLHRDFRGEWDYDLAWKPADPLAPRVGWLRAVTLGHRAVAAGLDIDVPVLSMSSTASFVAREWDERARSADIVLDAERIARLAPRLGRHVTVVRIAGGVHDLVLSAEPARTAVFAEVDRWLGAYVEA